MFKIASISALAGLLFGFDTGIISGAILFIQAEFALDTWMTELAVGVVLVGALLGSLCSARIVNRAARRSMIQIDAVLFIVSTLCSSFAPSLPLLILGRIGVGFAIGIACYVVPLYISELAPARFRGKLVALNTICVTGGILISYLTGCFLSPSEAWRWMLGLGVFPGIVLLLSARFLPESPRWLIKQGRISEARELLHRIREDIPEAESEIDMIQRNLKRPQPLWRELLHPKIRNLLFIGIALAMIQQATGINTILYYAPILFQKVGFQHTSTLLLLTVAVGLVNFLMTVVVMLRVDEMGRRTLLLWGLGGMTLSLLALGLNLRFEPQNGWLTLASLFAFVAAYAGSVGCIFWIVIAEIYPLNIRGLAMGVASSANWAANLFVALTFLSLLESIGPSSTFLCYAAAGLLSFLFCYRYLPETAQRSLEELESRAYRYTETT